MTQTGRPLCIDDIVVTHELDRRPSRAPDHEAENRALRDIAHTMSTEPALALQRLVDAALTLTRADSAGISLLEPGGEHGVFRWVATAGAFAPNVDWTMPRHASPCGEVMLRNAVLLMKQPDRMFPELPRSGPSIREGLLAPFHLDGAPVGTVWVVTHDPESRFEREDARLLANLVRFAAAAHRLVSALDGARGARRDSEGRVDGGDAALRASEERYLGLYNAIDQGFCIVKVAFSGQDGPTDYLFVEVSPSFEAQTGIKDAAGRWMRDIAPDQDQHWFDTYGRVALSGHPERFEAGSGPLGRWWSVYAYRVGNPAERTVAVLFSDITERKRAETALRESEERYRTASRVGRIGGWETDLVTGVRHWSPEAMDLFGLDLPDGKGKVGGEQDEWSAALHPEERERDLPTHVRRAFLKQDGIYVEYRIVRPDGRMVWLQGYGEVAARDEAGRPTRLVSVAADITESRMAAQALRKSEERFRSFAEHSADTLWIVDVETRQLEYLSPAFETMWGERRERVMADLGRWRALLHPDDRERAAQGMPRLLAGETFQQEYRIIRPDDGALRWIQDTGFPVRDQAGRVRRVAGIAQDVTERRLDEDRIRASRRRLRSLVEGIPQLVWRAVSGGDWTWSSPQWTRFTGLSDAESRGHGWLSALHEDDRPKALEAWGRAEADGGFEVEYRLRQAADGRHRWFQTRATPVRDEDGAIVEWLATSTDIDELRGLHEHQKLLLGELQHRVRNTLSVVRSIARRTADTSESVEDYAAHLDGRLGAFARTQAAVTRDPSSGISLGSLVAEELVAYGAREREPRNRGQVRISGPEIRLTPKASETLGLAIHELATNAVKYGALAPGMTDGRVHVDWRLDGSPEAPILVLDWSETIPHGPALPVPTRRGFGTELIERTLHYELKATTTLDFTPTGLRSRIELPLSDRLIWKAPPLGA